MSETLRLPLRSPIGIAGGERGVWIAAEDPPLLARLDLVNGDLAASISLDAEPVAVAATSEMVVVGLASGAVVALEPITGGQLWRRAVSSGQMQIKPGVERVWVWDRAASALVEYDRSGSGRRLEAQELTAFAPARLDGVYWLSAGGVLGWSSPSQRESLTARLPPELLPVGTMVFCANALWLSAASGLLLVEPRALELRAALAAPEGAVPHLICGEGRLFGGLHGIFVLNPAADALVRPLAVSLKSPLRGLAVAGSRVWALESGEPVVHRIEVT